jgi:hypothetical protein
MALLEQVATVDERFAALRRERSDAFLARNARAIRRLQRAGLADAALDPGLASLALSAMVSRSAYAAFAVGHPPASAGQLADTLTRLWVNALGRPAGRRDVPGEGQGGDVVLGSGSRPDPGSCRLHDTPLRPAVISHARWPSAKRKATSRSGVQGRFALPAQPGPRTAPGRAVGVVFRSLRWLL